MYLWYLTTGLTEARYPSVPRRLRSNRARRRVHTGGGTSPCPELGYYSIPGGCFCGRATMFYLVVLREERYYSIPGGTFCGPADTRVLSLFPSLPPLSSAHPPFIGTSCCVRPFLPSFCGGPELRYYSISTLGFCGPKNSRRIIV